MSEAELVKAYALIAEAFEKFNTLTADSDAFENTRSDPLVTVGASKIASAGQGVIATKDIAAGTTVTEYVERRSPPDRADLSRDSR